MQLEIDENDITALNAAAVSNKLFTNVKRSCLHREQRC